MLEYPLIESSCLLWNCQKRWTTRDREIRRARRLIIKSFARFVWPDGSDPGGESLSLCLYQSYFAESCETPRFLAAAAAEDMKKKKRNRTPRESVWVISKGIRLKWINNNQTTLALGRFCCIERARAFDLLSSLTADKYWSFSCMKYIKNGSSLRAQRLKGDSVS